MKARGRWAILIALGLATSAVADSPPRDLRQEPDGHWTAWSPPATHYTTPGVHVVQVGDTLWGLAETNLGDGHLWPQIWEQNQYVLDAHWIYPGDPILLTAVAATPLPEEVTDVAPGDVTAPAEGEAAPADPLDERLASGTSSAPIPLGHEADVYCSGYISEEDEEFAYHVSGSEYDFLTPGIKGAGGRDVQGIFGKSDTEKYGLTLGDILYVDGGSDVGLSAGDLLTAVEAGETVYHPVTGDVVGRFYQYTGRIRILTAQPERSIAEIVLSCDPMHVGATLKPFVPEPIPLRLVSPMRPANYPPPAEALDDTASIIRAQDGVLTLGSGYLVYVDRGAEQNLAPGDIYTIYRRGRRGFPPVVMGELGILSVRSHTALGRILRSRYSIYVGDALLLK